MNIQLDKETLTRYVLGEVTGEERSTIKSMLEVDLAAQREVSEIRHISSLLDQALHSDAAPFLTDEQRSYIELAAVGAEDIPRYNAGFRLFLKAAAVLLVVTGIGGFTIHQFTLQQKAEFMASLEAPPSASPPRRFNQHFTMNCGGPEVSVRGFPGIDGGASKQSNESLSAADAYVQGFGGGGYGGGGYGGYGGAVAGRQLQSLGPAAASAPVMAGKGVTPSGQPLRHAPDPLYDPNQNYWPGHNTETYDTITDNPFKSVTQDPLSTFSIDVDTASYANVRRFLNQNTLPPKDAVRIEEMVNYFSYDYAPPEGNDPFAAHVQVATCPWAPDHRLARIGIKGWEIANDERPASNLVFLLDVSASMRPANKLPLLKNAMKMLVQQLGEGDSVAIAVYAGSSGLVLPPTNGDNQQAILASLDRLESGGSTNGGAGIQLAYDVAVQNFIKGGVNRVILATDGDFNVGTTNRGDLTRLIEQKAKSGVYLSILGFGMGNTKDATLEELSNKGNGNYAYIDTLNEARKVLVEGMGGTLVTIAKDVKIQVEFNPAEVASYRLIGYENRILAAEDFNDDAKDAGEIGAGHTVTALYELVPAGQETGTPSVDPLKYQRETRLTPNASSGELFTLKLRYKQPDGDTSKLLEFPIRDTGADYPSAPADYKFAASVAGFGMLLRDSPYKGNLTFDSVLELAEEGMGNDPHGYRGEFLGLVQKAAALQQK